ncbi:MAG: four helix bundle protein [Negativicutes bacterium]
MGIPINNLKKQGEQKLESKAIRDFKDLEVWQESMKFVVDAYQNIIGKLPKEERYALADQMKRCAVSVPSNIAEGHSRHSTKEYIHFLYIAAGSCAEFETQLIIANKLYGIEPEPIQTKLIVIRKMLNKLISVLKGKLLNEK